jgi:hypothetical protein
MNLIATLVHLAHNPPESSSNVSLVACEALATISISLVACEALATISYWLQSLANNGRVPDGIINTLLIFTKNVRLGALELSR